MTELWPAKSCLLILALGAVAAASAPGRLAAAAGGDPPEGIEEIAAPRPIEISGVAASPEGYAVVGDDTADHGLIWPGGGRFEIEPAVKDAEAIDFLFDHEGKEVWLILGEDERRLIDLDGGDLLLPKEFKERCGRGAEGLAARWVDPEIEVAVLWEGGMPNPHARPKWRCKLKSGRYDRPRVALFKWIRGEGVDGPLRVFELETPEPGDEERFRASDLVWYGEELLVLLASTSRQDEGFNHTWLQPFDLEGRAAGEPFKLEEKWGAYRDGKNWEALDWTADSLRLVMGYDADGESELVLFEPPEPGRGPGLSSLPDDKKP